jgi:hypothetical protein
MYKAGSFSRVRAFSSHIYDDMIQIIDVFVLTNEYHQMICQQASSLIQVDRYKLAVACAYVCQRSTAFNRC